MDGVSARETYSGENVLFTVKKVTDSTTWQEDVAAKWQDYARMAFPMYVAVHQKGVKNEAEGCVIVRSLDSFSGQSVDEMTASGMADFGARNRLQEMPTTDMQRFYCRKVFHAYEMVR